MSEAKKTKQEYILEAAKLYGLGKVEIDLLKSHLDGSMPNEFIERKTKFLFRLYDIYNSKNYNDKIDTDENGIINLNDYAFEFSKRRLYRSKIGRTWVVSSNLEAFLITEKPGKSSDIKSKFLELSDMNNFLLPQIGKQMGLDTTVFYRGEYKRESGSISTFHLTKNFLKSGETLIQGNSIVNDNSDKRRVKFENLLEATDKYVKKYYKKNKLPDEELEKAREEIRRGLIKQTIFNKMVFNEYESNQKWGLIVGTDKKLKLAPLYSYDYCAGVEMTKKGNHRVIDKKKEDIESFMLKFGKEEWFKSWIRNFVIPLDYEKAVNDMERITSITLSDDEKEYYKFLINKMHSKVAVVHNLNYDEKLVDEYKKEKLGNKLGKIKGSVSKRIVKVKKHINQEDSDPRR